MSHLTQQQIENMTIERARFVNGVWNILVMDSERRGYPVFFEGSDSDTDSEIIKKVQDFLLHIEHSNNPVQSSTSTIREKIIGSNIIIP